jgi:hypothetical protein
MTVHLGRQPVGTVLTQRLRVDLAPGRYIWSVEATDGGGTVRSSAAVASLIVAADRSHNVH